jgi:hypothetical protein
MDNDAARATSLPGRDRVHTDSALSVLVQARTRQSYAARRAAQHYESRFGHWEARASVRTKPRRVLDSEMEDVLYFPPELFPVVTHPIVERRGSEVIRDILIRRLYDYLHFTSELEELAVIPVATKISRDRAGLALPSEMRMDAFKIVTDEAWHAQFSFDLLRQVEKRTGVPYRPAAAPAFVARLDAIRAQLPAAARGAEALLFSVVSETLISSILADIPRDARLPRAVRDVVRDHAEDEGRHHAYFREVLRRSWPALDRSTQRSVGPWLPEIIHAFLAPDYARIGFSLAEAGLAPAEVEQVVAESWPATRVAGDAAAAAHASVRYFREVGALDDERTRNAFIAAGLVRESDV